MRSFQALILSIAIHLAVAWVLWNVRMANVNQRPRNIVELIEQNSDPDVKKAFQKHMDDDKTFVKKAAPPKELLTEKREKPARFSSADEQNVLEEQKAHDSGMTANRSQTESRPQPPKTLDLTPQTPLAKAIREDQTKKPPIQAKVKTERFLGNGGGDIRVGGLDQPQTHGTTTEGPTKPTERRQTDSGSQPLAIPNFTGLERGTSTIGETLPDDIKFGNFTALNTDRNLYYSFYSRMEDAVRPPWVRYARAAVYAYQTGAKKMNGTETWSTKVEVLLDPKGDFVRAIVQEGSGVHDLDLAPVEAFRDSKQFPHPPPEMVKADGYIHIYCMFTVQVGPQYAGGE